MQSIGYYKSKDRNLSIVCGRGVSKSFPMHRHKSISLGMVLKGSRRLTIFKHKYIIAEGDVFIINSEEPHSIGEVKNREHDYIVLSILPQLIIQNLGNDQIRFKNIIDSPVLAKHLSGLFEILIKNKSIGSLLDIASIVKSMEQYKTVPPYLSITDNRLLKAKNHLDQSVTDTHSLESLADKASLSVFHFSRLFKKYIGMSPHRYLLDNRLRCARELLEMGHTIFDIAIAAGFYDSSHFIRHFSKYYGVSPLEYQKGITHLP